MQCVFIGYPPDIKGYICLHPMTGRTYLTHHIIFDETRFPYRTPNSSSIPPLQSPNPPLTSPLLLTPASIAAPIPSLSIPPPPSTSNTSNQPNQTNIPPTSTTSPMSNPSPPSPPTAPIPPSHHMLTRAKTGSLKPKTIFNLTHSPSSLNPPNSLSQALKSDAWRQAMSQEFMDLQRQGTWDLVPPPPSHTILGSRWTYRLKLHADGSIARHKARLVAQGHKQQYGLDYHDTFNPVTKLLTIRILLTLALHHQWKILQFDVSNAFLHGALHDTVYVHQPPALKDPQFSNHVCLLKKFIYGLKQATRQWFNTFTTHLLGIGFKFSTADPSLLTYHTTSHHLYLLIYVDDILITDTSPTLISSIIHNLQNSFQIKVLDPINQFLGIQTISTSQGLFLSQTYYTENILTKASMSSCKPV